MRPETSVIRITVERAFHSREISLRPLTSAIKDQCSIFKEGETYQYTGFQQPQGFCPIAWQTIYPYAFTLYKGGDLSSWYGDPDVAILCCPDGRRPVIFRLERVYPDMEE